GLLHTGRTREAREVLARAYADVPDAAWTDKWFFAAEIARMLGEVEVEAGEETLEDLANRVDAALRSDKALRKTA
ncbi:MAG TPA: hypothetical protein VLX92_18620, partial [Kofleriaceae bacterium]|nr:hypothetical protein [Kofleriaceae bacterium]